MVNDSSLLSFSNVVWMINFQWKKKRKRKREAKKKKIVFLRQFRNDFLESDDRTDTPTTNTNSHDDGRGNNVMISEFVVSVVNLHMENWRQNKSDYSGTQRTDQVGEQTEKRNDNGKTNSTQQNQNTNHRSDEQRSETAVLLKFWFKWIFNNLVDRVKLHWNSKQKKQNQSYLCYHSFPIVSQVVSDDCIHFGAEERVSQQPESTIECCEKDECDVQNGVVLLWFGHRTFNGNTNRDTRISHN